MNLTQDQLKELVRYDPDTGQFWDIKLARHVGGKSTHGGYGARKYLRIRINGRPYYAHRLAWLYVHGYWPKLIDHINRDSLDNRLVNLRVATHTQNHVNSKLYSNNKTGFKGVSFYNGRFRATTKHNGKQVFIGWFDDPQEAHAAYLVEARRLHGEFTNED